MATISIRIPQIGEGLQEARLVAVLKQPGDKVKRDEPIYQMETDKAVMDVESPHEGTLVEWLANPDEILAIGAEVARMEVDGAVEQPAVHGHHGIPGEMEPAIQAQKERAAGAAARAANVPPRTRAYAKEKGISEEQLAQIPAAGSKLMPGDIDAFLQGGGGAAPAGAKKGEGYEERPIGQKQRLLASRLVRGTQLVVPGTITVAANWTPIENLRARIKSSGDEFQPSAFTMFAYAVVQALKEHPGFRSTMIGDDTLRTYEHVALGIAVALPGDQLVLAVVEDADTLSWREFADRTRERIEMARNGQDQANEAVTISLTNMQSFGLRDAVPVVVPPAVATVFLGEVYNGLDPEATELKLRRCANLAMTFDHRMINGVGAAEFLNAIRRHVETIDRLVDG
jgi:pyruvate/2-oxoglutarate dehydrogenase complex dihydrolipoamide acyltransferase (E2) component